MPETPCLFGNQTAVFLKCAEIDCGFKTSESPALRGFVGGPHAKATAALYLVLLSNGQIRGETLRNRAWPGGKHPSPKARFSIVGAGFTGPFHTSPQTPQRSFQEAAAGTHATPAPNRAHSSSQGETGGVSGGGRYHYPRTVSHGSEPLRAQRSEEHTLPSLHGPRERRREAESLRNGDAHRARLRSEAPRPRWAA